MPGREPPEPMSDAPSRSPCWQGGRPTDNLTHTTWVQWLWSKGGMLLFPPLPGGGIFWQLKENRTQMPGGRLDSSLVFWDKLAGPSENKLMPPLMKGENTERTSVCSLPLVRKPPPSPAHPSWLCDAGQASHGASSASLQVAGNGNYAAHLSCLGGHGEVLHGRKFWLSFKINKCANCQDVTWGRMHDFKDKTVQLQE